MGAMASQITSLTIVYSTVYSDADKKKTIKLCVTGLCVGNSPGTGEFPAQMASDTENVSIWWRHHALFCYGLVLGDFIKNNVWNRVELSMRPGEDHVGVYFPSCFNSRNKHKNNTRKSADSSSREYMYIILFLVRQNESINEIKNEYLHTSTPCLTGSVYVQLVTSQSITDDVTMTRQLWHEHANGDI